jgi:hypothetical protein
VGDVSDCYTPALRKNPKLNGKLILEWEINAVGDAKDIKIIQGLDKKMDQCIVGKVEEWAFVPPPDGKVAKVRYPFVFAPPSVGEKPKSAKCTQIESEYAGLCVRDANSGECTLDERKIGDMLNVIRSSPRFEMFYLADLDRILKNPKPSQVEVEALVAKLHEDCWTEIHLRMWNSIFYSFKNGSGLARKAEAKEVLGGQLSVEVPSPTLLALSQDLLIVQKAVDNGTIKLTAAAKKDFDFLRAQAKKLTSADISTEPEKVVRLVRQELKAVKPLRAQLKYWTRKYWKDL